MKAISHELEPLQGPPSPPSLLAVAERAGVQQRSHGALLVGSPSPGRAVQRGGARGVAAGGVRGAWSPQSGGGLNGASVVGKMRIYTSFQLSKEKLLV